jgi:hypothetical protein
VLDAELVQDAHDRPAQVVAAARVVRRRDAADQRVEPALQLARVERGEGLGQRLVVLQADARREALGGERAGELGQHGQRALAIAAGAQQAREGEAGVAARGLELERAAEVLLAARGHQRVGLRGQQRVEELGDDGGRLRADELRGHAAGAERLDGRNALDAEGGGQARVRVRVHLGEGELAVALAHGGLQQGRQLAAGAAPGGPEVDHHRELARARDDVLLEGGLGGVEDHGFQATHPAGLRRAGRRA